MLTLVVSMSANYGACFTTGNAMAAERGTAYIGVWRICVNLCVSMTLTISINIPRQHFEIVSVNCGAITEYFNIIQIFCEVFFLGTRVGTLIVATIYLQLIQKTRDTCFEVLLSFTVVTSIVYNPLSAMWKS